MRGRVVAAARGWLGTRFAHQGRLRATLLHGGGVDCLGLLMGVADELALVARDGRPLAAHDVRDYSAEPDGMRLCEDLRRALWEIAVAQLAPGDVVALKIGRNPQHMAIVSDYVGGGLGLIHAYAPMRAVVEHRLDGSWLSRAYAAFSPTLPVL